MQRVAIFAKLASPISTVGGVVVGAKTNVTELHFGWQEASDDQFAVHLEGILGNVLEQTQL